MDDTYLPKQAMTDASYEINERIAELMKALSLNPNSFARKTGLLQQTIQKIVKNQSKPGYDTLKSIIDTTKVSANWLMNGEGPIFKNDVDRLMEEVNARVVGISSDMEILQLPVIDPKAAASYCDNIYQDLFALSSTKTYPVFKQPGIDYTNAYIVEIEGNSMYPTYKSGTRVIARPVPEGRWAYATGVHAISLKENMFTVKRIVRNQNNAILLKADNPDYEEEFAIEIAEILCMFKIGEIIYAPAE